MSEIYLIQDSLFRVWGKLLLITENESYCFGTFDPMPDFQYLAQRFRDYETRFHDIENSFSDIAELTDWMVRLRPRIISINGLEIALLSACIKGFDKPTELEFHGLKLHADDLVVEDLF